LKIGKVAQTTFRTVNIRKPIASLPAIPIAWSLAMLTDSLPFSLSFNANLIAAVSLWSLALYLGLFSLGEWVSQQLGRWLNYAERSLYTSETEFERTRQARESQNAFYASFLSIIPFFFLGWGCEFLLERSLGQSWAISLGILACIGCGIYELGRRDGQSS
jgi:hypothetical protein